MKYTFWTLFVIGFVACSTLGIGPTLERAGGSWLSPAMIGGSLVGVALLAVAAGFAFPALRPSTFASDNLMVFVLAGLIATKFGISAVHAALVR